MHELEARGGGILFDVNAIELARHACRCRRIGVLGWGTGDVALDEPPYVREQV